MLGYNSKELGAFFGLRGKNGRAPEVKGEELIACCPFPHRKEGRGEYFEKNPSFAINLRHGKYNCYSCGQKGLTIEDLAWALGKESPDITRDHYLKEEEENEKPEVPQRYKTFLGYYREEANRYFTERGISEQTTEKFGIGGTKDGTKVFIPLCDKTGKLEGWQERNLVDPGSRWSIEPFGFQRSAYIFGLEFAPEKGTILVESTTDVLRLDSLGYSAVATLGAAVSEKQLNALCDSFVELTLVKQNDEAGRKWFQNISRKLAHKMDLYYWDLPNTWNDVGAAPDYALKDIMLKRRYIR